MVLVLEYLYRLTVVCFEYKIFIYKKNIIIKIRSVFREMQIVTTSQKLPLLNTHLENDYITMIASH